MLGIGTQEATFNVEGNIKTTPLFYAMEKNYSDIAKLLMTRKEVDTNFLCSRKYYDYCMHITHSAYQFTKSILFLAVENNNVEIVRSLLSNPNININFESSYDSEERRHQLRGYLFWINRYKKTALFLAVEKENYEIVKLILSNENVDVNYLCYKEYNQKDTDPIKEEKTPLAIAVAKNNIEIVNLLLSHEKIDVNIMTSYLKKLINIYIYDVHPCHKEEKETLLSIAIHNNNIEIIKLLLQKNIDMSVMPATEKVRTELHKSNTINRNRTYLEIAIKKDNLEIFNLLLENKNIDVNLCSSCCKIYKNGIKNDISNYNNDMNDEKDVKKTINKRTFNALRMCIKHKKILLERKDLDINAKTYNSLISNNCFIAEKTALELAVDVDNIELVKLLLERKDIDVNVLLFRKINDKIVNKHTVLHTAVKKMNKDIIQLLSDKKGTDVDINES